MAVFNVYPQWLTIKCQKTFNAECGNSSSSLTLKVQYVIMLTSVTYPAVFVVTINRYFKPSGLMCFTLEH